MSAGAGRDPAGAEKGPQGPDPAVPSAREGEPIAPDRPHDAWNPGLDSTIPPGLIPSVTLYRPGNSTTSPAEAREAAEFCGTSPAEMVDFTFDRLVTHEVLIRVTADIHVPDGPAYEDLGLNLRSLVGMIIDRHVAPERQRLKAEFEALAEDLGRRITARLAAGPPAPAAPPARPPRRRLLERLFAVLPPPPAARPEPDDAGRLAAWQAEAERLPPGRPEQAALEALVAIAGGIIRTRGALPADRPLIARLATSWARNRYGSTRIGEMIDPLIRAAAAAGELRLLPGQPLPIVLNVKGASASGKSTIRSLQRELAGRLGIAWEDFALISPDYWRKFLLDYGSLGPDYKYAAMLTGQELELIDHKLDEHVARKAARGEMPHLLIDRFRFDSFATSARGEDVGNLLSRFGSKVFIFFMITAPAETVERAWQRGLKTGRYKAVDDLLYHNIEAYAGIPAMFFAWTRKLHQKVHVEFLDNNVPEGQRPRTVAYGWNGSLTILDHEMLRQIGGYQNVNVDARRPEDVLAVGGGSQPDFLAECIRKVDEVVFADPQSLEVLGRTLRGRCVWQRGAFFREAGLEDACAAARAGEAGGGGGAPPPPIDRARAARHLIGAWPGE